MKKPSEEDRMSFTEREVELVATAILWASLDDIGADPRSEWDGVGEAYRRVALDQARRFLRALRGGR